LRLPGAARAERLPAAGAPGKWDVPPMLVRRGLCTPVESGAVCEQTLHAAVGRTNARSHPSRKTDGPRQPMSVTAA